jgi:hypothetical protein
MRSVCKTSSCLNGVNVVFVKGFWGETTHSCHVPTVVWWQVVVKRLKEQASGEAEVKAFQNEAAIMNMLGYHPNIVRPAAVLAKLEYAVVMILLLC